MADDDQDGVQVQDAPPSPMLGVRPPLILRGDPNQPRAGLPTPEQQETARQNEQIRRAQYAGLPLDQAQRAVSAAIQFQAQRGYQADLARGVSAPEALAKWGPALFQGHPQAMSSAFAQSIRPRASAPSWVPGNPTTGEPGHFVTRAGGVSVPRVAGAGELSQVERDDLRFAEREVDKLQARQDQDVQGRSAANAPDASKLTAGQRLLAQDWTRRQQQIQQYQSKIDSYHSRVSRAVNPPEEASREETESQPGVEDQETLPQGGMTRGVRLPTEAMVQPPSPRNGSKVDRANALRRAHPDWTKRQIIDAVNRGG